MPYRGLRHTKLGAKTIELLDLKIMYEGALGGFNLALIAGSVEDKERAAAVRRKVVDLYRQALLDEAQRVLGERDIAFGTLVVVEGGKPFMAGDLHPNLQDSTCYLIDGNLKRIDYRTVAKWVQPTIVLNCEALLTGFWFQETPGDKWTVKLAGANAEAMANMEPGDELTGTFTIVRNSLVR